jgi:hypothetical protein
MGQKLRKVELVAIGNPKLASGGSITVSGKSAGNLEVGLIGPQFMPNYRISIAAALPGSMAARRFP